MAPFSLFASPHHKMKWVVLGALLAAGAGIIYVPTLRSALPSIGADAPAYRTAAVERGDLTATVTAARTLNAVVQVEVGSQVSGQIKELYADFNAPVTEGQVIARIDPEGFEAKVAQAQADLEIAQTLVRYSRPRSSVIAPSWRMLKVLMPRPGHRQRAPSWPSRKQTAISAASGY
jgi:multidrug efflux pump subunit AcrA (membrane-fusion protein)